MAVPDHIAALVGALLDEERARFEVRSALHRQADTLRELRRLGVPASTVAHRVAHARGLVLDIAQRLRLAERLRKRAWRGTRCPGEAAVSHGPVPSAAAPCDRATTPANQEMDMARIVKKTTTVTEEYLEPDHRDEEDLDQDGEEHDAEEDESPAPTRRRRK